MKTAAPSLLELQRALRASLVTHDDRGISLHVVDAGMSPAERLGVYRNTFASVLTTALRLSYPAVHRLVGAEFFNFFNTPNFNIPNRTLTSSTAFLPRVDPVTGVVGPDPVQGGRSAGPGAITSLALPMRVIQFGLKFQF